MKLGLSVAVAPRRREQDINLPTKHSSWAVGIIKGCSSVLSLLLLMIRPIRFCCHDLLAFLRVGTSTAGAVIIFMGRAAEEAEVDIRDARGSA